MSTEYCSEESSGDDGATDGRPFQETRMSWARIDYSAERPDDKVWRDSSTPAGIPDAETSRTGFDPSDVTGHKRRQWKKLRKLNDGVYSRERAGQIHRAGIARDLGVVASRLNLTEHQHDRAKWLLDRLELKEEVIPLGPIELAVIGVVTLAVDEERTRYGMAGKQQSVLRDDRFDKLCEEFEIDRGRVRNVRQRVRETDVYESPNR
ncbi:hypothetical protein [Halorubrum sp. Atlit-28R]|uniref:hypothetical protein n=1 Tax=Halorubrum sp. Atlit-28R TaxID=2282129 RepID=UPI0011C3F817|nr:hypothetical protein [Halorubrum sp. Atlit-28R]